MTRAALALHEATGEAAYLERAKVWQAALDTHYADAETGGYYLTADDAEGLVLRPHSTSDDATPNHNAVAAGNLVRLAVLTGDDFYRGKADRLIENTLGRRQQSVRPHRAAQCARPAAARSGDRDYQRCAGPGAGRAQAALSRADRAARLSGIAGFASGARKDESGERSGSIRLRRRALFVAGHQRQRNRRSCPRDAIAQRCRLSRSRLFSNSLRETKKWPGSLPAIFSF